MKSLVLIIGLPLTLAGVAFWVAGASAADNAPRGPVGKGTMLLERHPEADTDGDGQLSQEEIQAWRKNQGSKQPGGAFGKGPGPAGPGGPRGFQGRPDPDAILLKNPEADTDGDGKLSPEELRAFGRQMFAQQMLARQPELDTDGDGILSDEEMQAGRKKLGPPPMQQAPPSFFDFILERFDEADLDGNGELSREEIVKMKRAHAAPAPPGFGQRRGPVPPAGKGAEGDKPEASAKEPGAGTNQDISPQRRARFLERHPEADKDGDGVLSDAEIDELRKQMGGQRPRTQRGPGTGRGAGRQAEG